MVNKSSSEIKSLDYPESAMDHDNLLIVDKALSELLTEVDYIENIREIEILKQNPLK